LSPGDTSWKIGFSVNCVGRGPAGKLPIIPFSRNFDSDFLVAVDFRVDRAAKEERHTPALVFVKM
jgi:hypothetical protein